MVATVEQLAALVRGRLVGDGSVSIQGARPVGEAGPGDITFVEDEKYAKLLKTSPASAAIVGPHFRPPASASEPMPEEPAFPTIEVDDPLAAFLAVREHL
ncbi:MAG TPA: LpxD N-terminal domain-containing protein, partial [Isosphaeraceae bacterium]|nr:LpxD N-terminal domain-containing protein [Isosphaeraceae bacterium]